MNNILSFAASGKTVISNESLKMIRLVTDYHIVNVCLNYLLHYRGDINLIRLHSIIWQGVAATITNKLLKYNMKSHAISYLFLNTTVLLKKVKYETK